jgi:hypothetical protein
VATCWLAYSGSQRLTGSLKSNCPRSTSIITATDTTGLVME